MPPWICPRCRRHVPGYVFNCHCGAERPESASSLLLRSAPTAKRMPWQIWASLVAFVLVMLAGIVRFVFPPELPDYPPLLGVVDRPRPTPPPRH